MKRELNDRALSVRRSFLLIVLIGKDSQEMIRVECRVAKENVRAPTGVEIFHAGRFENDTSVGRKGRGPFAEKDTQQAADRGKQDEAKGPTAAV